MADSHLDLPVVDASEELPRAGSCRRSGRHRRGGPGRHDRAHPGAGADRGPAATFSRDVLGRLLRKELGFAGAVVSDALEMGGASDEIGVPEAAVRALLAGNDLLCFGGELAKDADVESVVEATVTAIVDAVRAGRLTGDRLEEAAAADALSRPSVVPTGGVDSGSGAGRGAPGAPGRGHAAAAMPDALVIQLVPPAPVAVGEVPWGLATHVPRVERSGCRGISRPAPSRRSWPAPTALPWSSPSGTPTAASGSGPGCSGWSISDRTPSSSRSACPPTSTWCPVRRWPRTGRPASTPRPSPTC